MSDEHRLVLFHLVSGAWAVSCSAGDLGRECKTWEEAESVAFGHVLLMLEMVDMADEQESPEPPEPAPEPPPEEQTHSGAENEVETPGAFWGPDGT